MTAPSNKPCSFPGCTDPRRVTRSGASEYPYCYRHNVAFERMRHQVRLNVGGSYHLSDFERDVRAGVVSVDALMVTPPRKRSVRRHRPIPSSDEVLRRIAQLPPLLEPSRLLTYKSEEKQTNWADYRCKCAFWRKRVDVWLLLNGAYRPPREMDDSARATATATARLAVLMDAEGSEAA